VTLALQGPARTAAARRGLLLDPGPALQDHPQDPRLQRPDDRRTAAILRMISTGG
jgi:hypothetical protein